MKILLNNTIKQRHWKYFYLNHPLWRPYACFKCRSICLLYTHHRCMYVVHLSKFRSWYDIVYSVNVIYTIYCMVVSSIKINFLASWCVNWHLSQDPFFINVYTAFSLTQIYYCNKIARQKSVIHLFHVWYTLLTKNMITKMHSILTSSSMKCHCNV